MNVIFILIAVSLLVAIGFLAAFIWSIRAGQFDDEYTPSVRILFDDEKNVVEEDEKQRDRGTGGQGAVTQNSELRTQNSELKTQNSELK